MSAPREAGLVVGSVLNPATVAALLGAIVSLFAAACVYPLGRAPDWEDLRPLTWVALTAAMMAAANVPATLVLPATVYAWFARLQMLSVVLHILAWYAYLPGWARRPGRAIDPALWPLPVLGLVSLIPGVVYGTGFKLRAVPWLGVVYRDTPVSHVGELVWAAVAVYAAWGIVRVARWGRSGAPYPVIHLVCTGALFVMGVHDALVLAGVPAPTPYLLDFASSVPIILFAFITVRRIAEHAAELHRLRFSLESAVVERSRSLDESREALARAERLASLGQFAAGVAHEVNNPAAVIAASLGYLAAELEDDGREGIRDSLRDAEAGVQRIAGLSRQLLLAGRTAGRTEAPLRPVRLAEVLEPSMAAVRARSSGRVSLASEVAPGLWVKAHPEMLVQVLSNLLLNAAQAIPSGRDGHVIVRAESVEGVVRIVVEDDGVGMSAEELQHIFEPFYSTKMPGVGTGLGLTVTSSLVEGMRGALRFESFEGRGTRAFLEMARAEAPAPDALAVTAPPPIRRSAILVIDDDEQVLRTTVRLLGRRHDVLPAKGVEEGLRYLVQRSYDLVLCDVMMPAGGGERFWAEILVQAPHLLDRVAFMTGGGLGPHQAEFLQQQHRPVLFKPFDASAVEALLSSEIARQPSRSDGR